MKIYRKIRHLKSCGSSSGANADRFSLCVRRGEQKRRRRIHERAGVDVKSFTQKIGRAKTFDVEAEIILIVGVVLHAEAELPLVEKFIVLEVIPYQALVHRVFSLAAAPLGGRPLRSGVGKLVRKCVWRCVGCDF